MDLKLLMQVQGFINSHRISCIRIISFEKDNTSFGVEYLFTAMAEETIPGTQSGMSIVHPTLSKCRERDNGNRRSNPKLRAFS